MISLVIPMYNEEKIIEGTIKSVKAFMDENFKDDYEALFVNDGSRDNTLAVAEKFACDKIKIISYEQNRGKGHAVRTGILAAGSDIIFFTDCDLAYGLDVIREGAALLVQDKQAGMVIGSRRKHKDGYASYTFLRKVMSLSFFAFLKIYGGIKQDDSQSGLKGFRREAAHRILKLCEVDGWSFDFEIVLIADKLNIGIIEMPVKIINHGESKINVIKDSVRMLKDISVIKKRVKNLVE